MSSIIKRITIPVLLALLVTTIAACNKENLDSEQALHVLLNGYNGTGNAWRISIDTSEYRHNNYIIKPATVMGFNTVYTYRSQKERFMTVTDTVTKQVLLKKLLPATGTKANFNFIYVDGHEVLVNPPVTDPATNKVGFYTHYTANNEPLDMFLYRKDANTGHEYRQYLAKAVKPNTWIYVDYIPGEYFDTKNLLDLSQIYFTKAGTTNQWAFQNNEEMSKISAAGSGLPLAGEKGLVLPYFFINGSTKLEFSRLFFTPDRFN